MQGLKPSTLGTPMSALGHKQTFAVQNGMSALPPIADICSAQAHVRFVPTADIGWSVEMSAKCQDRTHAVQPKSLLGHLIGGQK
jgi:hypothetical protein